ncbi:MAG TPA: hypothetical protein DCZ13_09540 [Porticoccaceae bacterium]|nr:hypothetical protein [Porticoccaceae bacterium]
MMFDKFINAPVIRALVFVTTLGFMQTSFAYDEVDNTPSGIDMTADLVLGRPALLATTIVGAAIWVAALPFSALGGNVVDSGKKLVVGPAKSTFVRCLGCKTDGYGYKDQVYSD